MSHTQHKESASSREAAREQYEIDYLAKRYGLLPRVAKVAVADAREIRKDELGYVGQVKKTGSVSESE